ncbi:MULTISPECIES: hypothetical protein [Leptolyngbya]|uniref:hypothetical protein n=1 Tax=Leptolyngbya TaxID=47251 RepID=UPI0019BE64CB|nr:hypothetical protein [Leptolyngbya sp. FACHB-1624]
MRIDLSRLSLPVAVQDVQKASADIYQCEIDSEVVLLEAYDDRELHVPLVKDQNEPLPSTAQRLLVPTVDKPDRYQTTGA